MSQTPAGSVASSQRTIGGWIVHPAFDLFFYANLYWPLFLLPGFAGNQGTVFDFWQIYYLTLPHRWITLLLVALDPDRREGIGPWIAGALFAPTLLIVGLMAFIGDFRCLALVDFVWNAWHFGSQHAGILRIYDRRCPREGTEAASPFERYGIRLFVFYILMRTAEWALGGVDPQSPGNRVIAVFDFLALGTGLALFAMNLRAGLPRNLAKIAYLTSMLVLYGGLLGSLMGQKYRLSMALATAVAMFHAVEYLAIVSHYASRRAHSGAEGAFRELSRRWLAILPVFMILLGAIGFWADEMPGPVQTFWIGLNLWMALIHYAVDGMIWKLRRPRTAQALGLGPAS